MMEKDINESRRYILIQEKLINFLRPSVSSKLKGVQREATLLETLPFKQVRDHH